MVRARLGDAVLLSSRGAQLVVSRVQWLPVITFLRADPDTELELLVDVFALDHTGSPAATQGRFDVCAHLRSPTLGYRATVVCRLPAGDPTIPTLTGLFPSALALERELFEMHGIVPDGHPALRPLLLYDGFVGHPLRRDYRAHKEQPLVPLLDDVRAPVIVRDDDAAARQHADVVVRGDGA
jgi:NADH-quinone oxidoreductase subunit C